MAGCNISEEEAKWALCIIEKFMDRKIGEIYPTHIHVKALFIWNEWKQQGRNTCSFNSESLTTFLPHQDMI